MSNEIEAAGAAATAGLAAGALEGGKGRRGHGPVVCPNCGSETGVNYCGVCGQPVHVHRSLGHLFEEALHGLFHFDSRAWRTAPMLAFRPGTLTRGYIDGRRARYISPVALFLLTVFLMFFAFALLGEQDRGSTNAELQSGLSEARRDLADADADAEDRASAEARIKVIQAEIDDRARRVAELKAALARVDANAAGAKAKGDVQGQKDGAVSRAILVRAISDPYGPPEGVKTATAPDGSVTLTVSASKAGENVMFDEVRKANEEGQIPKSGWKMLDDAIHDKLENPALLAYKIENTAYKFSFLLVPISLPFVWLLFLWRRGLTLFDHLVFILYSLSFMSVLFVAMSAIGRLPYVSWVAGFFSLVVPIHMYFQLKGTYGLGWFSALWRTAFLLVSAFVSIFIFFAAILLLGLLG